MSKIRINELARELEVKPNVIIDLLHDLGVPDKKTHSSSLDDDVALEVRRRVAAESGAGENGAGPSAVEAPHQTPPAIEHQAPAHLREAREQPAAKTGPGAAEGSRTTTRVLKSSKKCPMRMHLRPRNPIRCGHRFRQRRQAFR